MLIYQFYCEECDKTHAENNGDVTKCRLCRGAVKLTRIIQRSGSELKATAKRTIYSRALAIDPSQVEEAMRLHPDEVYKINPKEGIAMMEIRGAKHQAEMAKRYNMVDKGKY